MKQLVDTADDCAKHVEELTWQLDEGSGRRPSTVQSPTSDVVLSQRSSKSVISANSDSCRVSKVANKSKGSPLPLRSKPHISNDSRSQQHQVESKSVSASIKKLKHDSTPNRTAKLEKKQKVARNMSVSDADKKLRPAQAEVKSDRKTDFAKSDVLSNGDHEEIGIVSFIDEVETDDSFLGCHRTPLLHAKQRAMFSDFESAVIDEYVDRGPVRNIGRYSSSRRTDHDSSDEDVFDLIASGRINKVMRQPRKSPSNYDQLQPVAYPHQTGWLTVSAGVDREPMASEHQLAASNVDNYDSASSADTDVIIRSHRLMSEVTTDLHNQSFSSTPNASLNITHQNCNDGSREQLTNISEITSPSRSLAKDRPGPEHRRKKKQMIGQSLEAAVKNGTDNPAIQKFASIVDENSRTQGLPIIDHTTELKRKRKRSELDLSDVTVKSDAFNADSSVAQATKSVMLPRNVDIIGDSDIKQRKTDVSLLII